MKCVVTGGAGFIGSYIVEKLSKENNEVILFDIERPSFNLTDNIKYVNGDIRYIEELDKVMQGTEEVYDVAGVLGTSELMDISSRAVDINIRGAVNVLESCKKNGVKKIFHPTKPNVWLNTYSTTKYAAEQFHFQEQQNGLNTVVLKWFNAYGPRQHIFPIRKAVPLFILQAQYNLPITIWGDGSQTMDLIHVRDIADIAVKATRSEKCSKLEKVLDVGVGEEVSVKTLAEMTIEMCGSKSEIKYLPMRPGETPKTNLCAEVDELKKYIDIKSFVPLEEGLIETVEYYKHLPEWEIKNALKHFNLI